MGYKALMIIASLGVVLCALLGGNFDFWNDSVYEGSEPRSGEDVEHTGRRISEDSPSDE